MKESILKIIKFLKIDIWKIRTNELSKRKSFCIRHLKIMLLAIAGFDEDRCHLRASALTYYSLLSVVPFVALFLGIARGFGFEKVLEAQLYKKIGGQGIVVEKIITFSRLFLENTKGGIIAGVGIVILLWSTFKVLGTIENSLNDIWGIKKNRPISRKCTDYLFVLMCFPVFLVVSRSLSVLITQKFSFVMTSSQMSSLGGGLIFLLIEMLPFLNVWIVFSFIYIFMPNTKVYFKSGILGGLLAGIIYCCIQWIYLTFQIGVARFGAFYGSFAVFPLFLVWMRISWLVVLFGAEISFAEQNAETYQAELDYLKISPRLKRLITLKISYLCVKRFDNGQEPWRGDDFSRYLQIPSRLCNQILFELTEAKVLAEIRAKDQQEVAFQPARNITHLSLQDVMSALEKKGINSIHILQSKELKKISNGLCEFEKLIKNSPNNILLKDF